MKAMKNEHFLQAVSRILDAPDEKEVFSVLVSLAPLLGFESSRMYAVNRCPFRKVFVYSLAAQWPNAKTAVGIGYKIAYPTIPENEAYAFERASEALSDERKHHWIEELGLIGKEWIDLELRSNGNRDGLWCLSRPETKKRIEASLVSQLLCLAKLATTQVESKRTDRAVLALSRLDEQKIAGDHSPREILESALRAIQLSLNAQFIALFRWSPEKDCLVKELELSSTGKVVDFGPSIDASYPLGTSLTGCAYSDSTLMFVPFFDHMREAKPDLADMRSIAEHGKLSDGRITSVIYQPLSPIASCPGVIRIINRVDQPALPFQQHDAALLRQLVGFLERTLSVGAAGSLFANLEGAVGKVLNLHVSQEGAFEACEKVLSELGFSGFRVLTINESGRLSPTTTWPKSHTSGPLNVEEATMRSIANFRRRNHEDRIRAVFSSNSRQGNKHAISFLRGLGTKEPFIYLYFTLLDEVVFIVLPVRVEAPAKTGTDFWLHSPALANALLVIIELCAHGLSMRANRDTLRDAETSVAVIAHEFRSPSVSLRSLANTLISDVRRVLRVSTLVIPSPVNTTPPANPRAISSQSDVLRYLDDMSDRVESSDMRLSRAVKDGLMWARMGSNVIELEFSKVQLVEILQNALNEVHPDLIRRGTVTVAKRGIKSISPIVAVPDLIQGLLVNLLDNAIKYSFDHHTIEILGSQSGTDLVISITNFGLGISEIDLPHIFTPFYRAKHRDPRHPIRGVGLGLPTCQRIVQLHSGAIKASSKREYSDTARTEQMEGYLTTFTVTLPANLQTGRRDVQST